MVKSRPQRTRVPTDVGDIITRVSVWGGELRPRVEPQTGRRAHIPREPAHRPRDRGRRLGPGRRVRGPRVKGGVVLRTSILKV